MALFTNKINIIIVSILIISILPIIVYINSDFYLKKDYFDSKELEFKSLVSNKFDEHPVRNNPIYLDNGIELRIPREIFDKLKVGDTVLKNANSDTIIYKTKFGIYFEDFNSFKREKYLKSLK
jgi:hypothetical protein